MNGLFLRPWIFRCSRPILSRNFSTSPACFKKKKATFDRDGVPVMSLVSNKEYPMKIIWKRPEHVPRVTQSPEGSGDLEGLPDIDMSKTFPKDFDGCEALEKAPKEVKEVTSLKFQRHKAYVEVIEDTWVKSVADHDHDKESLAAKIASITVKIRNHQKALKAIAPKKNQARKHNLKILIDVRRDYLKKLRALDYKRFEFLLEKLNIVYKPQCPYETVERKKHTEMLTDLWCSEFKSHKLEVYRLQLEKQQPEFLRQKADFLRWAMKEEAELGLPSTVRQEDIDECLRRADEIESRWEDGKQPEIDASKYKIFNPNNLDFLNDIKYKPLSDWRGQQPENK